MTTTPTTSKRGFAAFTPEERRDVARMGGKAAQATGKAHRFTSEEARAAGRIGGIAASQDRARMAAIGAIGGKNRHRKAERG